MNRAQNIGNNRPNLPVNYPNNQNNGFSLKNVIKFIAVAALGVIVATSGNWGVSRDVQVLPQGTRPFLNPCRKGVDSSAFQIVSDRQERMELEAHYNNAHSRCLEYRSLPIPQKPENLIDKKVERAIVNVINAAKSYKEALIELQNTSMEHIEKSLEIEVVHSDLQKILKTTDPTKAKLRELLKLINEQEALVIKIPSLVSEKIPAASKKFEACLKSFYEILAESQYSSDPKIKEISDSFRSLNISAQRADFNDTRSR